LPAAVLAELRLPVPVSDCMADSVIGAELGNGIVRYLY
jgi:hypothetical protein